MVVILLLALIAVGVLLCSEAGQVLLGFVLIISLWLICIAVFLGVLFAAMIWAGA